jgi:hypothetical protein
MLDAELLKYPNKSEKVGQRNIIIPPYALGIVTSNDRSTGLEIVIPTSRWKELRVANNFSESSA